MQKSERISAMGNCYKTHKYEGVEEATEPIYKKDSGVGKRRKELLGVKHLLIQEKDGIQCGRQYQQGEHCTSKYCDGQTERRRYWWVEKK